MKLRLMKVVVQPVFVLDDGDNLTEQAAQPITVNAADWPGFPDALEADRVRQEAELAASAAEPEGKS